MEEGKKRSASGYLRVYLTGFVMGAADVVPGVSGGTMAFILGIYDELLAAIRDFTSIRALKMLLTCNLKSAVKTLPWPFLLTLGLGILSAIGMLASLIKYLLENELPFILAFFFGLVAASIITVFVRIGRWGISRVVGLVLGTAAGWLVVGLEAVHSPPETWWYLMFCGALAICAMILPGISGSFILLLLGRYELVLGAVSNITHRVEIGSSLLVLVIFTVGVVLGIASFVRLLSWTLRRFHDVTIAVLAGFMIGSLRKVWPWKSGEDLDGINIMPEWSDRTLWTLGLLVLGFALVMCIELAARRLEKQP